MKLGNRYSYHGKDSELLQVIRQFGRQQADIRLLVTNERRRVPLSELTERVTLPSAAQLVFSANAARIRAELSQQAMLAPIESNIVPLPHQILALEKVMTGENLRFLLADEVGMGKTIETGLVLKELKLRGIVKRCLVITPVSAMPQWKNELKRHFNEDFHLYDTDLINVLTRTLGQLDADNPVNIWAQNDQIIIPIDALRPLESRRGWTAAKVEQYNRFRIQSVIDADFDLLVIDECHKVGGSTEWVSRYRMAQTLCQAIPNVLLLSATPHRGKSDHFRRILQLLDGDAFAGEGMPTIRELEPYVVRTEKRLAINYDGKRLFNIRRTEKRKVPYQAHHARQMKLYDDVTQYVVAGFNQSVVNKNQSYGFVMVLFQRLMSSSTQAILQAMERRAQRLASEEQNTSEASVASDLIETLGDVEGQMSFDFEEKVSQVLENVKAGLQSEGIILRGLIQQARECQEVELDAKAAYLLDLLRDLRRQAENSATKFLIFTEFTATQTMLAQVLNERGGYVCETINGSMTLDARVEALKRFKGDAQIMIATDAAGESLNMQFAHIVINYDMPWNPMVVEQRIGRVDRIGQAKEVVAVNLMLDNSIDERVYEVIEEKLSRIMSELGIDKTADVLDSTLETKSVQDLYLTSLLNPAQFEAKSTQWLEEIKEKLKAYHSTEGTLPTTTADQIQLDKSDAVKRSPLPIWLENMTKAYLTAQHIAYQNLLNGHLKFAFPSFSEQIYTFDVKETVANPIPEPLSIQHEIVQTMLKTAIPHFAEQVIPCLKGHTAAGYWSLWRLKVWNSMETHEVTQAIFVNDGNASYPIFAEDFWQKLSNNNNIEVTGSLEGQTVVETYNRLLAKAEETMQAEFEKLEATTTAKLGRIKQNKGKAFAFQRSQYAKLGIENIKQSRLLKLEKEIIAWERDFAAAYEIASDLSCLLLIRLDA